MVQKKLKKMGAFALAFTMAAASVQFPAKAEENSNIIENGENLPMPTPGVGETIRFCADYEQIIGEDGTVYTPLEDKDVTGFFETTTKTESGTTITKSAETTYRVKGEYLSADTNANPKPAVIPELQEWHGKTGSFAASVASKIVIADDSLRNMAEIFQEDYRDVTGMELKEIKVGTKADARICDFYFGLTSEKKGLGKEGYTMDINDAVSVEAEDPTGAYYATRTILQILKQTNGSIPKGLVRDYPKYEVRAFMLDVGRKAFSMDTVKQFVRNMSWYKMNSFQLHLNDNLIFIEDHKLPSDTVENLNNPDPERAQNRLNAVAQTYEGFRLESDKKNSDTGMNLTSEDMYYTKDEIRSLIQDSRMIGIDVVPEFDMPAHALSFTKTFPEYMSMKDSTSWGNFKYTYDELDLSDEKYSDTIQFAYSIWDEYITGENPVFDEKTTVHIGTDEHHGDSNEGFRKFSRDLIKHITDSGRKVRMWGSLSNKGGVSSTANTVVPSEGVQLNIWEPNTYAKPLDMYNAGFDIINTSCNEGLYIVPRGTGHRGTSYDDYLDTAHVYNNYSPNKFGSNTIPAGSDQMLGGCYAVWHDYIDTRANGISEYDSFDRFFEALPYMSAKLWGEGKDRNYTEFTELIKQTGTAPGTTIYGEVDYKTSTIAEYTFEDTMEKDSSINHFNLSNPVNVQLTSSGSEKALKLNGGSSYLETPDELDMIGDSAVLTMKVRRSADAPDGEQILCESKEKFGMADDSTYGTYAFKAVQKNTGKVGFSREGYDYSFNYAIPKDDSWHELEFHSGQDRVALYVDNVLIDDDPSIYYFNHPEKELSDTIRNVGNLAKVSTMLVPFGRIGSKLGNSFCGEIASVKVTGKKEVSSQYGVVPHSQMTAEACTYVPNDKATETEGPVNFAIDDREDTYWHTDWSSDVTVDDSHHHFFKVTLDQPKTVSKLTYLPRQNASGRILEYSIDVEEVGENGSTATKTVVEKGTWENNLDRKTAEFNPVKVKSVTLKIIKSVEDNVGTHATIAELNLYEPMDAEADLREYVNSCNSDAYQRTDYTDQSWNAFLKVKEKAESVLNYSESTEADYLYAYEILQQAAGSLTNLTFMDSAAKTRYNLSSALADTEEQLRALEGTAAKDTLQAAIQAAKEALEQGSEQTDFSELLSNLQNAGNLDKVSEKTKETLIAAIADANKMLANTKGFTAASVKVLQDAITAAENTLEKPDVSIKELEDEIVKLQKISLVKDTSKSDPGLKDNDPFEVDGIKYQVVSASALTAKLVKGKDTAKVTINTVPHGGKTYKIVEIGDKAFNGCKKKLKKVTIGANVTTIGKNAFKGCKKLANVVVQSNSKLNKVGSGAFKKTSSKIKIKLPKTLKKNKNLKKQIQKAGIKKIK